jgi:hypothetical protein
MDNIRRLEASLALVSLKDMGINFLHVEYSGGGDSGSIESITPYSTVKIMYDNNGVIEAIGDLENYNEIVIDDHIKKILDSIESEIIIEILNDIEDWWNNEGGYGNMYVDLTTGSYIINNHQFGEADYDEETEEYDYENQEEFSYTHNGKL